MFVSELLEISIDGKVCLISMRPCNRERDGQFIRELTRANFYDYFTKTIGWNEERHQEEPKFLERYLMLFIEDHPIGFLSLREEANGLYLETLQLVRQHQRQGIGTAMIRIIEGIAQRKAKDRIRLRVFKDNPAQSLYHRLGFKVVEDQGWVVLMEKVLVV
jgi:ribosomal protein S18 acetylase RimI-like enzyme